MSAQNNLSVWNKVSQAPNHFLKKIEFGYLKGKSDINPQWRLMAMTQAFGMIGHGWTYRIVRTWTETGADGQMMAFSEVAVKTKFEGEWGEEFSGIGGSMICQIANGKLKSSDEGYKMATTDALSVAFKAVGVAADIYLGNFDGSKYLYDYSAAYNEPVPPKPVQAQSLTDDRFKAALGAVEAGSYDVNLLLDETKFALTSEQKAALSEFTNAAQMLKS